MSNKDGGPAFPIPGMTGMPNDTVIEPHPGMSMRAYIATKVLAGIMAKEKLSASTFDYSKDRAAVAVRHADALIAELAK